MGSLPNCIASYKTVLAEETAAAFLAGKPPHKKLSPYYTLGVYEKTPIFINAYITEDVDKFVT